MKRYCVNFLRVSVFIGVVVIGWIAIAKAQRQSDEVVSLPPPPTNRATSQVTETDTTEYPEGNNPYRRGSAAQPVATSGVSTTPASASTPPSASRSAAIADLWANAIPAAPDSYNSNSNSNPTRAYNAEPTDTRPEASPVRMTNYSSPAGAAAEGPTLAAPTDRDPLPPGEGGYYPNPGAAPTATEAAPQPNLAGEAADDPFPNASTLVGQPRTDQPPVNQPQPTSTGEPGLLSDPGTERPIDRANGIGPAGPADSTVPAGSGGYGPSDQGERTTDSRYGDPGYGAPASGYSDPRYSTSTPVSGAPASSAPAVDRPEYSSGSDRPYDDRPYGSAGSYGTTGGYGSAGASLSADRYASTDPGAGAPIVPDGPTGTGQPARDTSWDGEQLPQLRVYKVAPKEIQVGKPAVFRVEIENVGRVAAHGVEVRDQIPQSTRLVTTKPESVTDSQGGLVWQLGEMKPGAKASVEMTLMPTSEGSEIGSVAMVRFGTPASVRTVATKPMIEVDVIAEESVMVENETTLTIRISNPGSGVATGVVLEERIPQGMQHAAGTELEYEVGDLAPKASKTIQLKLAAVRPGATKNVLIAKADGLKEVVCESDINVVAPALKITMNGPQQRYLNRQASYEVSVSNPGSAAAKDVRLVATLPPGLKFVEANNNGYYDPNTRTVQWALAELPVNETGAVQLTAMPVEMGEHAVQVQGTANRAVTVKQQQNIRVDGIAALRFEVVDVNDPIEVGSETSYEVRVLNQGTKDASNVVVRAILPAGLEIIAAEGPGALRSSTQGGQVVFDPIQRLAPKVDTSFRIRVRGTQAGDQRLRIELSSDDLGTPVIKEESTRVFGDR